jgi:hypothetical protein
MVLKCEFGFFISAHAVAWIAAYFGGDRVCWPPGSRIKPSAAAEDSYRQRRKQRDTPILDQDYYSYYHGHSMSHLEYAHNRLHDQGCRRFVFFCGDSSLDNKFWFIEKQGTWQGGRIPAALMRDESITASAVNGYAEVLKSNRAGGKNPRMAKDVCYWFNRQQEDAWGPLEMCTVMSAVEASTAADRYHFGLLEQDKFIRDRVTADDIIIMSVGGNDVALSPTIATAVNMFLLNLSPHWITSLGLAPGYRHFVNWFYEMVCSYISKLTKKGRPAKVVVNMIYYPDEQPTGGWADLTLSALLYRQGLFPGMLQFVIRSLFHGLSSRVKRGLPADIEGLDVSVFPLFEIMDGKTSGDYEQRVEPSVQGGEKMARGLLAEAVRCR